MIRPLPAPLHSPKIDQFNTPNPPPQYWPELRSGGVRNATISGPYGGQHALQGAVLPQRRYYEPRLLSLALLCDLIICCSKKEIVIIDFIFN